MPLPRRSFTRLRLPHSCKREKRTHRPQAQGLTLARRIQEGQPPPPPRWSHHSPFRRHRLLHLSHPLPQQAQRVWVHRIPACRLPNRTLWPSRNKTQRPPLSDSWKIRFFEFRGISDKTDEKESKIGDPDNLDEELWIASLGTESDIYTENLRETGILVYNVQNFWLYNRKNSFKDLTISGFLEFLSVLEIFYRIWSFFTGRTVFIWKVFTTFEEKKP